MGELRRILSIKNITIFIMFLCANVGLLLYQSLNENYSEKEQTEYVASYNNNINSILENADRMKGFSIFQSESKFAESNIEKTVSDYKRVQNLNTTVDNGRVTNAVVNNKYRNYMIIIYVVYILYDLLKEHDNGMWGVIHSQKNGRGSFSLRRERALIVIVAIICVILVASDIVTGCVLYGIDDFSNPIQTLQSYGKYTELLSKSEYICMYIVECILVMVTITTMIYMLFIIMAKRTYAVISLFIVLALEGVIYKSETLFAKIRMLQYFNIYNFLDIGVYDRNYVNINFFENAVSLKWIVLIVMLCIILTFSFGIFLVGQYRYYNPKKGKLLSAINIGIQKCLNKTSFYIMEISKSYIFSKTALLVIAGGVIVIGMCKSTKVNFPERQLRIDKIYEEYGGSDTEGFIQYVDNLELEIDELNEEAQLIVNKADYSNEEFYHAMDLQDECAVKIKYLEELQVKKELINRYKEKGISINAISDRGYNEILGNNSYVRENVIMIVLLIISIICAFELWYIEKKSNMIPIVKTSSNGREWLWRKKICLVFLITTVVYALFYGYDFFTLVKWYKISNGGALVQSLTFISESFCINIREYIIIKMVYRYILIMFSIGLITMISTYDKIKNQMYVIISLILVSALYLLTINGQLITLLVLGSIQIIAIIIMYIISKGNWIRGV